MRGNRLIDLNTCNTILAEKENHSIRFTLSGLALHPATKFERLLLSFYAILILCFQATLNKHAVKITSSLVADHSFYSYVYLPLKSC